MCPFFQGHFSAKILIGNNFGIFLNVPAAVSIETDGCYCIFIAVKSRENRSRGTKRNIVLARPAAV